MFYTICALAFCFVAGWLKQRWQKRAKVDLGFQPVAVDLMLLVLLGTGVYFDTIERSQHNALSVKTTVQLSSSEFRATQVWEYSGPVYAVLAAEVNGAGVLRFITSEPVSCGNLICATPILQGRCDLQEQATYELSSYSLSWKAKGSPPKTSISLGKLRLFLCLTDS